MVHDARRTLEPSALRADRDPARIEVRRPREDLILTREKDGPWRVTREADLADGEAVEQLLGGLRALEFGPPLGADEAAAASGLGPADNSRVRVLDSAGAVLFDGYFGRRAFARSAYFRAGEHAPVRLASGLDTDLLTRPSSQWREPRLLPGRCASSLEASAGGPWRRVSDENARELCALRAVPVPDAPGGFDKPLLKIRAAGGGGFTIGERRGGERLVRVDGRSALLKIPARAIEETAADLIGSKP